MEQLGRLRGIAGQRTTDLAADLRRISQQEPIVHGGPILVTRRKLPAPQFPDMFLRPLVNARGNLLEEDPVLPHFQKFAGIYESEPNGRKYTVEVQVRRPGNVSVYLTPEQVRELRVLGKIKPSRHRWTCIPGQKIEVTAVIEHDNSTLKRVLHFVPGLPGEAVQVYVERQAAVGAYGADFFLGAYGNAALDEWFKQVLSSTENSKNVKVYYMSSAEAEGRPLAPPAIVGDPHALDNAAHPLTDEALGKAGSEYPELRALDKRRNPNMGRDDTPPVG